MSAAPGGNRIDEIGPGNQYDLQWLLEQVTGAIEKPEDIIEGKFHQKLLVASNWNSGSRTSDVFIEVSPDWRIENVCNSR